ncbi:MAG: GNAT family N-acetyltransferase [Anaerolineales bacterium]|nr:GNAT family N-acetyltransferase [Anaerolineales bacterium]
MNIIRANLEHTDLIAPLFDSYRQFYKAAPDLEASREFIHQRLTNNESIIFLALDDDKAIGFVQLYPLFASVYLKPLWLLNDIYVYEAARGQGAGEALMKEAEDFASNSNSRGLFLRTATDNFPAQRLYERCGWVRDEKFYRYDKILK